MAQVSPVKNDDGWWTLLFFPIVVPVVLASPEPVEWAGLGMFGCVGMLVFIVWHMVQPSRPLTPFRYLTFCLTLAVLLPFMSVSLNWPSVLSNLFLTLALGVPLGSSITSASADWTVDREHIARMGKDHVRLLKVTILVGWFMICASLLVIAYEDLFVRHDVAPFLVSVVTFFVALRYATKIRAISTQLGSKILKPGFYVSRSVVVYLGILIPPTLILALGVLFIISYFSGLFGLVYHIDHSSFTGVGKSPMLWDFYNYAMMNVSTLSYTSIVPVSGFARFLSFLEWLVSGLWLLVFFAAVIAHLTRHFQNIDRVLTGTDPLEQHAQTQAAETAALRAQLADIKALPEQKAGASL